MTVCDLSVLHKEASKKKNVLVKIINEKHPKTQKGYDKETWFFKLQCKTTFCNSPLKHAPHFKCVQVSLVIILDNVCRRSIRLNTVLVPGCLLTLMWSCRLWVRLLQRIWGLTSGDYFNIVSERFDRHADASKNNRDVSEAETALLLPLRLMLLRSSWLSMPLDQSVNVTHRFRNVCTEDGWALTSRRIVWGQTTTCAQQGTKEYF